MAWSGARTGEPFANLGNEPAVIARSVPAVTSETATACLSVAALALLLVGTSALRWGTHVIDRDDPRRPTSVRVGHRCLFFAGHRTGAFSVDPDPRG
jgi:hypothetical protein